MKRFVQSTARTQITLFPEQLEDYVTDDNPVRVVDVFVEQLDLGQLGFDERVDLLIILLSYSNSTSTVI